MARYDRLIARAIEVAATSTHRWRVGCVIAGGPRVMAQACNTFRNPPHIDHFNASRHAEMAAIARCTSGDTAYVARVDRYGQPRLARPCEECARDLLQWGIRRVVFTSDGGGYLVEKIAA